MRRVYLWFCSGCRIVLAGFCEEPPPVCGRCELGATMIKIVEYQTSLYAEE